MRGILYIGLAIPTFFSLLSSLAGVMAVMTALFDFIAAFRRESGTGRICCNKKASMRLWGAQHVNDFDDQSKDGANKFAKSCFTPIAEYWDDLRRGNMIGATVILFLYIVANFVLAVQRLTEVIPSVSCSIESPPCSSAACPASMCFVDQDGGYIVLSYWFVPFSFHCCNIKSNLLLTLRTSSCVASSVDKIDCKPCVANLLAVHCVFFTLGMPLPSASASF